MGTRDINYILKNNTANKPEVSIILIDWNVRESFHTLEYLNRQKIRRDRYEIIWIEYYDNIPGQLLNLVDRYKKMGLPLPIDTWLINNAPKQEIYHKHILYNIGIINSLGKIVVILDSDAIIKTTFVSDIIDAFSRQPSLALHFEQIRNFSHEYYPFNYPAIDEIIGPGCVNAVNGMPLGFDTNAKSLRDDPNIWHIYNYGACLCATRDDLISIGGADEHEDYLGYICGPYEMTARLINAGVPDRLHETHFLYHVYHPSQGGDNNYCGPNNGRGMSLTAMEILENGRIFPLKENIGIQKLRLNRSNADIRILEKEIKVAN